MCHRAIRELRVYISLYLLKQKTHLNMSKRLSKMCLVGASTPYSKQNKKLQYCEELSMTCISFSNINMEKENMINSNSFTKPLTMLACVDRTWDVTSCKV